MFKLWENASLTFDCVLHAEIAAGMLLHFTCGELLSLT